MPDPELPDRTYVLNRAEVERLLALHQLTIAQAASKIGCSTDNLGRNLAGQAMYRRNVRQLADLLEASARSLVVLDTVPPVGMTSHSDRVESVDCITRDQFRSAVSRVLALFPRDFVGEVFSPTDSQPTSGRYREPTLLHRLPLGVPAPISPTEVVTSRKCWMLVGGPGTGKSLWLVHIARQQLSAELTTLPVLVPLSSWASSAETSLGSWIASNAAFQEYMALNHPDTDASPASCSSLLLDLRREGRLVLLLDGWDELSLAAQQRVRDRLTSWIPPTAPQPCTILVASREGFPSVLPAFEGNGIELDAIDTAERRREFYKLYITSESRRKQLSYDVESHAELSTLKRNPFFLSLVAWLTGDPKYGRGRSLLQSPFHLVQLYERAIDTLLVSGRAGARDASQPAVSLTTWPAILSRFAWESLSEYGREPIPTRIAATMLRSAVKTESVNDSGLANFSDRDVDQALKYLADARLFIAQIDIRQWLHSSLHEFLAARHLASEHFDEGRRRQLGVFLGKAGTPAERENRYALLADVAGRRIWLENLMLVFDFTLQLIDRYTESSLLDITLSHWLECTEEPNRAANAHPKLRAAVLGIEGRSAHSRGELDRRLKPHMRWVPIPRGVPYWTSRGGRRFNKSAVATVQDRLAAQRWHTTVGEYKRFIDDWGSMDGWAGMRKRLGNRLDAVLSHLSKAEQIELFDQTNTISSTGEYPQGRIDAWLEEIRSMDPQKYNRELRGNDRVWAAKWEAMTKLEREAYEVDLYESSKGQLNGYQDWTALQKTSWNSPVVNVTWWHAAAYSAWLNIEEDEEHVVRLPFAHEWEAMVRLYGIKPGTDCDSIKRPLPPECDYPHGRPLDPDQFNTRVCGLGRPSPVGAFEANPLDRTRVWDVIGNVWCWTASRFDGKDASIKAARSCCGGSFNDRGIELQVSHRGRYAPHSWYMIFGFRPFRATAS